MTLRRYPGRGAPCAAALWLGAALTVSTGAAAAVGAGRSGASSAPDEDIRDIRALRSDTPEWVMPAVIAGAVLLALAAYGLGRRRRRRATHPHGQQVRSGIAVLAAPERGRLLT